MRLRFFTVIGLLLVCLTSYAGVLPDIFYKSDTEIKNFCSKKEFHQESFWRQMIEKKISDLIQDGPETVQNSYVSLSYLELFKINSAYAPSKFMGYVYANGSHHLGRLIRFRKWPKDHPLRKADQNLVKGDALRLAVQAASNTLAKELMSHSLNLYKELSWSLGASALCGQNYAEAMVKDPNLLKAYKAVSIDEFISPFVTFEQTYLQKNMYSDFLIGSSAKLKMLDEMRFISFNGEEMESFKFWCQKKKCEASSFDLTQRILFDVDAIKKELIHAQQGPEFLSKRAENANIVSIANFFLQ